MSKTQKIVAGVIAVFVVLVIIVHSSSSKSSGTTPTTAPHQVVVAPTPVPVDCTSLGNQYHTALNSYLTLVQGSDPANPSDVSTVKSYGLKIVAAGRSLISVCPQYSSIGSDLDTIERGANSL